MNLSEWFTAFQPVDDVQNSPFFASRREDINSLEEAKSFDLILMSSGAKWALDVRTQLSKLSNHFSGFSLGDLGYVAQSGDRIPHAPVIELDNQGVVTVSLSGSIELAKEMAEKTGKKLTVIANQPTLSEIPGESVSFLGYQRHLCSFSDLKFIDEFCPDSLSLGKMKTHPHLLEPILRDSEILYIHGNVLRSSEMLSIDSAWPTGIFSEDLCQIMKHAGSSLRLSSIIIDMGEEEGNENIAVSRLVAELMWYLLEGMKMKETDHPALHNHLSEYVVNIGEYDADMVFLKSNLSHRWWLKLRENKEYPYLSCAHEEYQQTIQSEVPDRLLRHLSW